MLNPGFLHADFSSVFDAVPGAEGVVAAGIPTPLSDRGPEVAGMREVIGNIGWGKVVPTPSTLAPTDEPQYLL